MLLTRLWLAVVLLLVPAVAQSGDATVHLYLQPFPSEAGRLSLVLGSVAALGATGTEYPLELNLVRIRPGDVRRQRLLASGHLPTGSYTGFRIRFSKASLAGEHGESAMLVPDSAVDLDAVFAVPGTAMPFFWLRLDFSRSVSSGMTFTPALSLLTPPRPLADHAGFVTNAGANTITVFDKRLWQAVGAIDTCGGPAGMALDQRRKRLYVACGQDDELQAVDVPTAQVVERARLLPGDRPREIALTPDGNTLVSANPGSNSVTIFAVPSLRQQTRLSVPSGPGSLAIDPAGRRAFVFNTLANSLTVIDLAAGNIVATVSTEAPPLRGQFGERGSALYLVHDRSQFMTVLDSSQLTTSARARVRPGLSTLRVDSRRNMVYLSGPAERSVEFYDLGMLVPVSSMTTKAGVSYMTADSEYNTLYMVSPTGGTLLIGSLAEKRVVAEIDVGDRPYWVVVPGEK